MSIVSLSGRKNLTLWFRRHQLVIGLIVNMRPSLVTLLGSQGGRNDTLCPH